MFHRPDTRVGHVVSARPRGIWRCLRPGAVAKSAIAAGGTTSAARRAAAAVVAIVFIGVALPRAAPPQETRATAPGVARRSWTPPRTADGHPDLEGIWVNASATPLERPAVFQGRTRLTDDEVAELRKRAARIFAPGSDAAVGELYFQALLDNPEQFRNPATVAGSEWLDALEIDHRTSLIVDPPDGRLPAPTAAARQRQADTAARNGSPSAATDLLNVLRCITPGVPRIGGNAASFNPYVQIVQTRTHVVIIAEMMHQPRIIPLDGRPPLSRRIRQWDGEPRGRWEGGTLVVETTNFSASSNFRGAGDGLRLTERFTRVAEDMIVQRITVDDAGTWTRPWTAEIWLTRGHGYLYEMACHEGNHRSVEGLLNAARSNSR